MMRILRLAALAATAILISSCNDDNGSTGAELDSGNIAANGGTFDHKFNTAGTFNYKCTIHPSCAGLQGTVVVVDASTPIANSTLAIAQGDGGACFTLTAAVDTIHVGQTIRWTNNSVTTHTVTTR